MSGRVWFLPTAKLALQFSAGQLAEAETTEAGEASEATRATASAMYHTTVREQGLWATTLAWGRNVESGHGSNAILAETNFTLRDRDSWFARFEVVGKTAHDLAVAESDEAFTVAKLQGGYTRYSDDLAWPETRSRCDTVRRVRAGGSQRRVWRPCARRLWRVPDSSARGDDDARRPCCR